MASKETRSPGQRPVPLTTPSFQNYCPHPIWKSFRKGSQNCRPGRSFRNKHVGLKASPLLGDSRPVVSVGTLLAHLPRLCGKLVLMQP